VLRIGLIGVGYWGPNYVRVIAETAGAELVYACDRVRENLEIIQSPDVRLTTDPHEVLADDRVDAVVVATPTDTHVELTSSALAAGKHVLCEKPLATSTADCDRLAADAEQSGRVLMVGHTFLFNPAFEKMRELVAAGEAGDTLYCHTARTGLGPVRHDVNALWDLAPHDVSMLLAVTERRVESVTAIGAAYLRPETEDVVFANLRMEGGALAGVHVSWLDPYKVRTLTVIGTRKMLVFNDIYTDEKLRIFDKGASYDAPSEQARGAEYGEYRAVLRDGDIVTPKIEAREPLKEQVQHFLDCCANGRTPLSDVVHGRRVVAVLEAASASIAAGGAPVPVADG
jgi:predicted dehydrogenase